MMNLAVAKSIDHLLYEWPHLERAVLWICGEAYRGESYDNCPYGAPHTHKHMTVAFIWAWRTSDD